jgi:hypothetical protein
MRAARLGAKVVPVRPGYLSVVQARAKDYAKTSGARLVPFGVDLTLEATGEDLRRGNARAHVMAKRGRKTLADLSVVEGSFGKRPEPPADLSPDQADIWRATVASEAAGFFSTEAVRALLSDYCRHRDASNKVAVVINDYDTLKLMNDDDAKHYDRLLKLRERETRSSASLATKMRLTNQARYTPQAAGTAARNAAKGVRPWET